MNTISEQVIDGRRRRRTHTAEFNSEFFALRHIRGKWACKCCQTLAQEPVAPQVIDKGMPTATDQDLNAYLF